MKNIITIIAITIFSFGLIIPFSSELIDVNAQSTGIICEPGTGGKTGNACVPCNPGPYGICIPDTGIIFTENETVNTAVISGAFMVFAAGIIFIVNGNSLKAFAER